MRYESSSSMSMSEKSSEVCDVSADMVTLRLLNERILERSCEASLSERPKRCAFANGRGTSGSARAFVRELRRSSRDRERVGGGDVERRARVCARGARRAVVQNFKANSQVFTCFSRIQISTRETRAAQSRKPRKPPREERASRNLCGTAKCERVSRFFFRAQKVGGFHRIARASSCLGHVPPRHPFPPPLNPPSTDHLLNTTTSAANATTPPAARNGALSCPEAWT